MVALLALIATVVYGEVQRRLAQKQLALAQKQADVRPELTVTLGEPPWTHVKPENAPEAGPTTQHSCLPSPTPAAPRLITSMAVSGWRGRTLRP
jgi:hypothetical protein